MKDLKLKRSITDLGGADWVICTSNTHCMLLPCHVQV